jgi:hypothetical protein
VQQACRLAERCRMQQLLLPLLLLLQQRRAQA